MNKTLTFTESLESRNGRIMETITELTDGRIVCNSYFAGMSNGKLYHFNESHSKKNPWAGTRGLFYYKPEIGAYLVVQCKIANNEEVHFYDSIRGTLSQQRRAQRLNQVIYNGRLQKLSKSKKGRCESCGIKDDRTHWAHLIEGKSLPVAELCMPCHRIYDLQGENVFVDKAGK